MTATAAVWDNAVEARVPDRSDAALVALARKGDRAAFSELARRHERIVYNLCYRYMREDSLAEDMAQEAFLKAFRLLKGFRGDCSFSTWMYRVACSVCLTELNRRKRRKEVALESFHEDGAEDKQAERNDSAEFVRRCVQRLPERYQTIVTLYYLEELPYEAIAETMEIPIGTLKTWMFRARKELRTIVEEEMA